jgi:hypothetical protein
VRNWGCCREVTCPQPAAQASIIKPEIIDRNTFMYRQTLLLRSL